MSSENWTITKLSGGVVSVEAEDLKSPAVLRRKSSSRFMKAINALPFIPDTFMRRYWTTIGHTIYVPTRYDLDADWGQPTWVKDHEAVIEHELIHVAQRERRGTLKHTTLYLGPSATVFLPLMAVIFVAVLADWLPWWPLWVDLGLFSAALPLSIGLAYGRWTTEREANMPRLLRANEALPPEKMLEVLWMTANKLWRDYAFPWPPSWQVAWYRKQLGI